MTENMDYGPVWPSDYKSPINMPITTTKTNYHTICLISYACKIMQIREIYMKREMPDVQDGFYEGQGR